VPHEQRLGFSLAGSKSHNIVLISRKAYGSEGCIIIEDLELFQRGWRMPRMVEDRLHAAGMRKGSSSLPFEKCWRPITTRACRSRNFGCSNAILSRAGVEKEE